jgi:hypothetical protein
LISEINFSITLNGQPVSLLASCLGDGDTAGGLVYYDGPRSICIDDVSTTGLFVSNNELIRQLWAPHQVGRSTSIWRYTGEGLVKHVNVDDFPDPHDVLWDGRYYVAVSSLLDSVIWMTPEGVVFKRKQFAQGADCWHVNSLVIHEGILFATAFGRFETAGGWRGRGHEGTGILFRVDTGEDILTGLCCPHTPRIESNQWIVCESMNSRLSAYDSTGNLAKFVQLENWVRGVAITDSYIFVGESFNRQLTNDTRPANIAILDRKTWRVLGRLKLPFREVYDLVLVSPGLLDGIKGSSAARLTLLCPAQIPRNIGRYV